MNYLKKIFYKFEISTLKYCDFEILNHVQVAGLLFRQRLSSLNFMFVSNSLVFMLNTTLSDGYKSLTDCSNSMKFSK